MGGIGPLLAPEVDFCIAALAVGTGHRGGLGPVRLGLILGDGVGFGQADRAKALQDAALARATERFQRMGGVFVLPAVLILEGGYATAELGINAANVIDGIVIDHS